MQLKGSLNALLHTTDQSASIVEAMLAGLPVLSELALLQCLAMCLFLPGLLEPEGHWPGVSGTL